MLIWDDSQTLAQHFAQDTSTGTLTNLKLFMNLGYKYILAALGRPVTEKTKTASTVASQQYYQLAPDYLFLKTVTVTISGKAYPVIEEESQEMWDYLNESTSQTSNIPERFFVRPGFGVGGAEIGFYPKPASAVTNAITVIYEATDRDLETDKYNTSTVTLTSGSATVTGSGTTFTAPMVGRYFQVSVSGDGLWYRIASFTSTTVITLENVYEGSSGAGLSYQIAEAFHLPEDIQILPVYYSAMLFYAGKKDTGKAALYKGLFDEGMKLAELRWGTKTRGNIIRDKRFLRRWPMATPSYFPANVT